MKLSLFSLAVVCVTAFLAGLTADAEVNIHAKNCTSDDLTLVTFNGGDGAEWLIADGDTLDAMEQGATDSRSKKLTCDAGCSWFYSCNEHCKLAAQVDTAFTHTKDVPKDHYARVYGIRHAKLDVSITKDEMRCADPSADDEK
jgi:hypothetical protein